MTYEVVIIGGGAAGLSAALMLGRARRRFVVIDAGNPRNAPAAHLHGYLSRDGMPPADLLAVGRAEIAGYGGELIQGRVDGVEIAEAGCTVRLGDGRRVSGRRLLVATGLRDELPEIAGMRELWGKDVAACPYCHGHEVRDQPLAVIGMAEHAVLVSQWSDDVIFFPHTGEVTDAERARLAARGVSIAEGKVTGLVIEAGRLRGVALDDGTVIARTAAFVRTVPVPQDGLLREIGCATADGWVTTDETGRTSVPGVWATGNVADMRAIVIVAAGQGAMAAAAINLDLIEEDIRRAGVSSR